VVPDSRRFARLAARSAAIVASLTCSSLTLAQAVPDSSVIVGPLGASSVPLLSPGLLAALVVSLAALAVYVLRRQRGAGRLLGILVLATGVLWVAVGGDRASAILPYLIVGGDDCGADSEHFYNAIGDGFSLGVKNDCPAPVVIKSFIDRQCPESAPLQFGLADCKVGTVLASGEYCSQLPYCLE